MASCGLSSESLTPSDTRCQGHFAVFLLPVEYSQMVLAWECIFVFLI